MSRSGYVKTFKLLDDGSVEEDPTRSAFAGDAPTEQLASACGPLWSESRLPGQTAEVSTIFVCFDQGLSSALGLVDAPALVFETMAFSGESYARGPELERIRTASFADAADAHADLAQKYLGPAHSEGWKDRGVEMKLALDRRRRAGDTLPPLPEPNAEAEAARLGAALEELGRQ